MARAGPGARGTEARMIDSGSLLDRARARVGTTLREKWRLDTLLGIGGMAAVYAGTHRNGGRAAIKVLHLSASLDPEVRQRFLREGYIANKVDHPGAVRVLDDDTAEDGAAFLVMELLDGQSLEGLAERRGGKVPIAEVLVVAGKLLEVLAAAHDKGIVHRDIKPDNVFITRDGGGLKLLDFGIARLAGATHAKQTADGAAFGTPAFMAPEQALGRVREVDARTDLWAVGATMFTLLAGREVHQADTLNALLVAHASFPAPALATVVPGVPIEVARVVDRALAFDKNQRWSDAREMRAAIVSAQSALRLPTLAPALAASSIALQPAVGMPAMGTVAPSVTAVPHPGSPRSSMIIGSIAGVLFVASGLAIYRFARPDPRAPAAPPIAATSPTLAPTTETPAPTVTPAPDPALEPAPTSTSTAAPSATARAAPSSRRAPPPPRGKSNPTGDSWLDRQH